MKIPFFRLLFYRLHILMDVIFLYERPGWLSKQTTLDNKRIDIIFQLHDSIHVPKNTNTNTNTIHVPNQIKNSSKNDSKIKITIFFVSFFFLSIKLF